MRASARRRRSRAVPIAIVTAVAAGAGGLVTAHNGDTGFTLRNAARDNTPRGFTGTTAAPRP